MAGWTISRGQATLGMVASVVLILSAGAHMIMGWPAMRAQLVATHAPAELITGFQIGWQFGGVAMIAFGLIALSLFAKTRKGGRPSLLPVSIIAATYILFGGWALFASRFDLFFLIFLIPGFMLAGASRLPPQPGEINPRDNDLS